jgi:hypothetical protein
MARLTDFHRQQQASMNIIYLECKLLYITKHRFDFIEMSVLISFWWIIFDLSHLWVKSKVAVVSFAADEAWDALLGVKIAEAGTTAAGGGALCFLLCSIGEWRTVYPSRVADDISLFNPWSNFCNMYFSVVISPNLIFSLQFSKITVFSLFPCFCVYSVSWTIFICLIFFYVSTSYK